MAKRTNEQKCRHSKACASFEVREEEKDYAVLRRTERCRRGIGVVVRYGVVLHAREETVHHHLDVIGEELIDQRLVCDARVVHVIEEDGEGGTRVKERRRGYDASNSGYFWGVQ